MDDRLRVICAQFGCFLRREALALGYDDKTIAFLRRTGVWHRIRRGAYTFGEIWARADERERHRITARAVCRAAKTQVVASHTTAIVEHTDAYWDLDLTETHVTREDGRTGRREAGVAQHQGAILPGDMVSIGPFRFMSPTRSGLELTTIADTERSLVVIEGLVHQGKTTPQQLRERYASMTHWPDTLHTDLCLRLLTGKSQSVGETRFGHFLWREGFPPPQCQYEVRDEFGNLIGILDFAWPELGVFVEFDGKTKYSKHLKPGEDAGEAVFREKRREDRVRETTGWICLRVVWADLDNPVRLAARLRAAFARTAATRRGDFSG